MWCFRAAVICGVVCLVAACGNDTPDGGPLEGSLQIGTGVALVNTPTVRLELSATPTAGATLSEMAFSNDGTTFSAFEPFAEAREGWPLSTGDGLKKVHAKVRDSKGGEGTFTAEVQLDATQPVVTAVVLDDGADYTRQASAALGVSAPQDSGSTFSQLCTTISGARTCGAFAASTTLTLPSGDGLKTVSVTVVDAAGNESVPLVDSIVLDATPPTPLSLTLAGGVTATKNRTVAYAAEATDAATSIAAHCLTTSSVAPAEDDVCWTPSSPMVGSVELPAGDGAKTVHAWFLDAAGNVSASASASVLLDQTSPTLTRFALEEGAAFTGALRVRMAVDAADLGSGLADLCFGTTSPPTTCVPFSVDEAVTVEPGDGAKTLYAFVRDVAGNESGVVEDQITVDQTAPVVDAVSINAGAEWANARAVTVTASATEAGSGVARISFSIDGGEFSTPVGFIAGGHALELPSGEGVHTVAVRLIDGVGNTSAVAGTDSIGLDVTPPTDGALALSGTGGAEATKDAEIAFTVSATDASSGYAQFCLTESSTAPGLGASCWTGAATSSGKFVLTAVEGVRSVHAWFRDAADNVSAATVRTIVFDVTAPVLHGLTIAGGLSYAPAREVTVEIDATEDVSRVATLCIGLFTAPHECVPYTGANTFDSGVTGDGVVDVWAFVVDAAGNSSNTAYATFEVDEVPPVLTSVAVNGGGPYATSRTVNVALVATDNYAGLGTMEVSLDGGPFGAPVAFSEALSVELPSGEGLHSVAVRVYDQAGHVSATVGDGITLDTTPPSGSVVLSGGATYAPTWLTASLDATDANGVAAACLTTSALASAPEPSDPCWEAYASTRQFDTGVSSGSVTVQAWFRDQAGLTSTAAATDDVLIDSQMPTYPENLTAFPLDRGVRFTWSPSSDDLSGVSHYELRLAGMGEDWLRVTSTEATIRPLINEQEYTLEIRTVDHAGNVSFTLSSLPFKPRFPFAYAYRKPFGATLNALVVGPEGTVHAFGERGAAFESGDLFASGSPTARRFDTSADADWYGAAGGTGGVLVTVGSGGTIAAGVGVRGWRAATVEGSAQTLLAVAFVGDSTFVAVGDGGRIVRGTLQVTGTEITALSVTTVSGPTSANLRALARSSVTKHVVAVGDGGALLRSLDDGATWEKLAPPSAWTSSNLSAVTYHPVLGAFVIGTTSPGVPPVFTLPDEGAMGSLPGAELLDGAVVALHHGANEGLWMIANLGGAGHVFHHDGTKFIQQTVEGDGFLRAMGSYPFEAPGTPPVPTDGVALVGESGQVAVRTAPGFVARTFGLPSAIHGFSAIGNLGWAVGAEGMIAHTTNFGDTWELQASGTGADLLAISAGPGTAYAVGEGGIILERAWNAASWAPVTSPTSATLHSVDCVSSWCMAVGEGGVVAARYTSEGWIQEVAGGTGSALRAVDTYTDAEAVGRTIAVGDAGTVRLQLADGTWSSAFTIAGGANLTGVAAAPGGTVLAVTDLGKIWKSADHGATWTELSFSGPSSLSSVRHAGGNRWYVAGPGGAVFRTDDAGETWRRLATRSSASLFSLYVNPSNGDEVWTTGSGSTVLRTVSAGE